MSWGSRQLAVEAPWTARKRMDDDDEWADILRRVRAGEPAAERRMVERLWPRVAAIGMKWRPRNSDVEDLAQEVFLKVFSRLWQFRGGSFPAWVDRITRRVCYDALRRQRARPEWRFADLGEPFPDSGLADETRDPTSASEARRIVECLLDRLPPNQAWLIREVDLMDRSIGELSKSMGWSEVAGRLRLLRARRRLRREYESIEP